MAINKVTIVGMGALGLLYADHIQRAAGADAVEFVMDEDRVKKYRDRDFTINGKSVGFKLVCDKEAAPADLVIVAVKYNGLASALDVMKNSVGEDTVIMSVMNGISSEEIIGERYGMDRIVYSVAQGMDAQKYGDSLVFTQMGKIHFGTAPGCVEENTRLVKEYFDRIEMPHVLEEDIMWRMWFKFMLNVGINQICMVYNVPYSGATNPGEANKDLVGAMREAKVLANAEGIALTEQDLITCIEIERTLDPNGSPSMGQDRINRKPSEVEMFAGKVIELGKKHHVLVPVNEFIYKRVHEIESEY